MLGSDHDGERANAGRLADRMVRDAGLTWCDVVMPSLPSLSPPRDPEPCPNRTNPSDQAGVGACVDIG
jgi:hypothetical protein